MAQAMINNEARKDQPITYDDMKTVSKLLDQEHYPILINELFIKKIYDDPLEIKSQVTEQLEKKYSDQLRDKYFNMLQKWKMASQSPTKRYLIEAIQRIGPHTDLREKL